MLRKFWVITGVVLCSMIGSIVFPLLVDAQSSPITIGETAIFSGSDNGNGNLLLVQDAVLNQPGMLQSLSFYVTQTSGNLRLGVYDATGPSGGPGTLKAQTNSFTPVVGWNTANVTTPIQLSPGNYWLAYAPSSNNLHFVVNRSLGTYKSASFTFGSMPSTFPVISEQGVTRWSFYATLNTASGPDTVPPIVALTMPVDGGFVAGLTIITATASDNFGVTGVQFLLDGANFNAEDTIAPYSISWNTALASNGLHTILARARDAAGNVATSTPVSVTVDNLAPTGSVLVNNGATATNSRSVTLSLSASDVHGTVTQMRFSNNGTSFNTALPFAPTASWTLTTGQGTKTVYAQFKDSANNWSSLFTDTIVYDTSAPTISGRSVNTITANSARINWTTNELATSQANYGLTTSYGATTVLDAALVTLHSHTITGLNALTLYHYRIRTKDVAGNETVSSDGTFTTNASPDTIAPSVPTNLLATPISPTEIDLIWAASVDNVGVTGYKIFRDSVQIATTVASSFNNIGLIPSSLYAFATQAFDAAGNVSAPSLIVSTSTLPQLPVDTILPTASITSPIDGAQVSDIVTIMADAFDNVGVAGVLFFVDGSPIGVEDTEMPYGANWDTRTIANGAHILTAQARDVAGNMAMSSGVTINIANVNFFQNEILATGFNLPTNIEFLPDDRLLVAELAGTIKVLPPPYTTPDPTPFLQLNLNIPGYAGFQQGIFDIALDPNFTINHFYYVFYTKDVPNKDRLSRFTANAALNGTVPGSEAILYEDPQTANTEHHGGAINFGNDGKIYFTTGEHFDGANAQNLSNPRGKLHRINVDGTVPTDNPFYDGAGPNWDSIWAYGLRNPFRAYYDSPTDKLYIADVGGNSNNSNEEVDVAVRGGNYGWPDTEGPCLLPCISPLYWYNHNNRDASITGGFIYHGTQFPQSYQGNYFFADYTQNWIRRLTFNTQGTVSGIFNFEPADGSVDGPYGDIVHLTEGPDGALYYVDLGYSDVGGTVGISKIRRVRYLQSNLPPTAIANANPMQGLPPLSVNFSSASSTDPEGQPITYLWTFGDGTISTAANPVHVYVSAGQYTVRLTTSDGVNSTLSTPLIVSVGIPPVGTILSPQDGNFFIAGDVLSYSGDGTDTEDGVLPASAFTWDIDFLHAGHVHPGIHATGIKSGTFIVPVSGHDFSGTTRYRITLTVTDSNGLANIKSVIVWPSKVNLTFNTLPSNLTFYLDGVAQSAPLVYDTLINFQHSIEARNQSSATTTYTFSSWSDGGAQMHTITVPTLAQTYIATYTTTPIITPVTIGETAIFNEDDSGNGGLLLIQDATLAQTAVIQSLSFYVNTMGGDLRLGVYDTTGAGGNPGALKAQTNVFTPTLGWNTANVTIPVQLAAGNYWLAYFPSSNALHFATNFSIGSYKYANVAFGPMPVIFPAIAGSGKTHWSLYGTLSP